MSKRADEEGRACYLESSAEKNLKLYRRCGYEVVRRIVVGQEGKGGVPLDIMIREPRSLLLNGTAETVLATDILSMKSEAGAAATEGSLQAEQKADQEPAAKTPLHAPYEKQTTNRTAKAPGKGPVASAGMTARGVKAIAVVRADEVRGLSSVTGFGV